MKAASHNHTTEQATLPGFIHSMQGRHVVRQLRHQLGCPCCSSQHLGSVSGSAGGCVQESNDYRRSRETERWLQHCIPGGPGLGFQFLISMSRLSRTQSQPHTHTQHSKSALWVCLYGCFFLLFPPLCVYLSVCLCLSLNVSNLQGQKRKLGVI